MSIACFLDEKSAKLKSEGMDRMRVALAGSLPNCFLSLMGDLFGYCEDTTTTPQDAAATTKEPAPTIGLSASLCPSDPLAYQTIPDIGSGPEYAGPSKGPQPTLPSPYQAGTKRVKPSTNQK